MEILALHPGALGDIILSLPALNLLKQQCAESRLTLAGNLDYLDIVPESCADRSISLSTLPLQRLYPVSAPSHADIKFWTSFDRIVSWTGFDNPGFVRNLRVIHPDAVVAKWRPGPCETRHVSRIFCESLTRWITPPAGLCPIEMRPQPDAVVNANRWLAEQGLGADTSMVALQPGAGSISKRWPLTHFAVVGQSLQQSAIRNLLVIEGPAEPGLGAALIEALPVPQVTVARCQPLGQLAALLSLCRAYVGNDSGISHLAAALGVPCVVVFGPTSPNQWAPLGPRVTVLSDTSGCAACVQMKAEGHRCLENISPDDVLRVVSASLR